MEAPVPSGQEVAAALGEGGEEVSRATTHWRIVRLLNVCMYIHAI